MFVSRLFFSRLAEFGVGLVTVGLVTVALTPTADIARAEPSAAHGAKSTAAVATAPPPRARAAFPSAIEPLAGYVGETSCDPHVRRGTAKLAKLLATTYRAYGAASWNSTYACGTDGARSEHYDGRAIDWMVDIHNRKQHAAAKAAITWLLATDRAGNRFAMARRLGVMYLIYDNRMWGAWDGKWAPYNGCAHLKQRTYDNACHRTHMHISLSWNGAFGRTTFWTTRVYAADFGPCRARDLNWAYLYKKRNTAGCAKYPTIRARKGSSATKRALVRYSGAAVRRGWSGPSVSAVQRAVHVPTTGRFTARTARAVRAFQRAHPRCPASGAMNPKTWRALLRATR
ncbi:peptidoglycan-binding protein [uncultured Jatrophihabitans sp.]|uniref:peptidoglycan-binding domain-containing protein n=1 Tax=uncultured Jatrophihabitans sp. TaxID=1610747 RepID=UPI0035CAB884